MSVYIGPRPSPVPAETAATSATTGARSYDSIRVVRHGDAGHEAHADADCKHESEDEKRLRYRLLVPFECLKDEVHEYMIY